MNFTVQSGQKASNFVSLNPKQTIKAIYIPAEFDGTQFLFVARLNGVEYPILNQSGTEIRVVGIGVDNKPGVVILEDVIGGIGEIRIECYTVQTGVTVFGVVT